MAQKDLAHNRAKYRVARLVRHIFCLKNDPKITLRFTA
jgi:hypothetical protein